MILSAAEETQNHLKEESVRKDSRREEPKWLKERAEKENGKKTRRESRGPQNAFTKSRKEQRKRRRKDRYQLQTAARKVRKRREGI
ncbi:hypothetical protein CL3_27980 [butyrate-producing bacterium SM4/1]|nr:hypothetical protein CL3_27980 [butyrate-producing bacterium SM4/1]